MLIHIDHRSGTPIYRQIHDQVRRLIVSGRLAAGEQLVSVRDLGAQLKVNPMTISKAYGMLEQDELVERRRGLGLFVRRIPARSAAAARTRALTGVLREAAGTAAQLGMDEEDATALFVKLYREFAATKGN
ncbi:MAG: GntR family transcriptional regulator [Lentisphaerae bacterium]|jgi:GntR family transcriptional regulator|nr:GntR family transcriptional regulator [Lentisphaerota bacterium]MBT4818040.1 GntR family transcriptional regulator [Lentisphaerota bacterium]MBT5605010.1 GntR family transcriptional regulator [Lentisphaerota bacterium]MBT7054640.1 GntR family transcriptional regulator [Lentisphaerota bacterium]MBT7844669.1 GntR family transcriptional regulator [Lentisphaerota bacterium]